MTHTVWLRAPQGVTADLREVEAVASAVVPLMAEGWVQCDPPTAGSHEEAQ